MRLIQRTMVHLCPALGYMAPHLKLDLEQDQGGGAVLVMTVMLVMVVVVLMVT